MAFKRHAKKTLKEKVEKLSKIVLRNKPEVKYALMQLVGQNFNYSPTATYVSQPLTLISQGITDYVSRIGDTIFLKNINFKGCIKSYGSPGVTIRVVAVLIPKNIEGLITNTNVGNAVMDSDFSSTVNAVNAPSDNDNSYAARIIMDRRLVINPIGIGNAATSFTVARLFNFNLKINKQVEYFHGGVYPVKNDIFIFWMSDAAANANLLIDGVAKLTYTDV